MTLNKSVEIIACAVGSNEFKESSSMSEVLYDLALKHKAKAAILKVTGGGELVNLDVENGVATLSGLVESPAVKKDCERATLNIQGIKSIHNRVNVQSKNGRIF